MIFASPNLHLDYVVVVRLGRGVETMPGLPHLSHFAESTTTLWLRVAREECIPIVQKRGYKLCNNSGKPPRADIWRYLVKSGSASS